MKYEERKQKERVNEGDEKRGGREKGTEWRGE